MIDYKKIILDYYRDLETIKNAKEEVKKNKFQLLMSQLFPSAHKELQDYTSGLEETVKITEGGLIKNGRIDAFYGDLVIEFERNIPRNLDEGCYQIKEYCSALWNKNKKNYIGIVTDGINWHTFYPNILNDKLILEPDDIELKEKEKLYLINKQESAEEFYIFINNLFFREGRIKPTISNFKRDFGTKSYLYEKIYDSIKNAFNKIKNHPEINLSYTEWHKYLTYTYGSVDASESLYLRHSYLCVITRFIVWAALVGNKESEESSLTLIHKLLNGEWFRNYGIMNLVEDDFFHWISKEESVAHLDKSWLIVINQLRSYDFTEIKEDLLKGLYQELVDAENRHDLGEYYTPDWLCESICYYLISKRWKKFKGKIPSILDPACGSGSFLRSSIHQLLKHLQEEHGEHIIWASVLNEILNNVVGMDIHPLAVIISKTNYILAIKDIIIHKKQAQINIPVYLADSLFMPHSEDDEVLFSKKDIILKFDGKDYIFPNEVFANTTIFDDMIFFATDIAKNIANGEDETKEGFCNALKRKLKNVNDEFTFNVTTDSLFDLSNHLAQKIITKKDTIWSFILRNNFRPMFFRNKFDIVVGNPPWLTYNFIKDVNYQKEIKKLVIEDYKIAPKKQKLMTQMELATIFLVHSAEKFLKNGKSMLGFVMPRSVFNGDQHEIFRAETWSAKCDVIEYWDLEDVKPLFNVPSCVIFAVKKDPIPNKIYPAKFYSAKLPERDIPLYNVEEYIKVKKGKLFQCKLGTRTALNNKEIVLDEGLNYYKNKFFQGATIVPRNFYFIEEPTKYELKADELNAKTDTEQAKEGKVPWKDIFLSSIIETNFLYHTALSKHVLPFFITKLPYIVLPVIKENNDYILKTANELKNKYGYRGYPEWLKITEKEWEKKRQAKSKSNTVYDWLNYQNKLMKQNPDNRWFVLYNTSGKNISSAVLDTSILDKPFYADAKTYWYSAYSKEEAYYLCSIFNSEIVNILIKPFQSKGLLGERDIHTKVLEIPFPEFDKSEKNHKKISEFGVLANEKINKAYGENRITGGISKQRAFCRELVKDEIKEITKLTEELLRI